ncbi:MAG: hypothetical protein JNK46_10475 [Methylobacteriaceae bacterium]|nr:hypothetical protein [Methylobacteriaceae bacterium]
MLKASFLLCAMTGAAFAQVPDRSALISRMGPFPVQGSLEQKTHWRQRAVLRAHGRYMADRRVGMNANRLTNLRDRCVRTGQY